jgi:LmbE family N-acetylglucosaminyl deacetylase
MRIINIEFSRIRRIFIFQYHLSSIPRLSITASTKRVNTKTSHMKSIFTLFLFIIAFSIIMPAARAQQDSSKVRIIMIGAHPDDCDINAGGTAAIFASMGYAVKFLSLTNGDAGHQSEKGTALAARRLGEATEAARRLGITYDVLNNHDGHLTPSIEIRLEVIRKIREWGADVVIAPRPNDYHPDHRYAGILVQDAAYLVAVPNIAPETPALKKNAVFLYFQDRFQRPYPFQPDIAVDIDAVFDKKVDAMDAHESQVYEWLPWIGHYSDQVPKNKNDRKAWLAQSRSVAISPEVRKSLEKWYGPGFGGQVKHAEAFQICEYGVHPSNEEIKRLFPMLPKR